MKRPGITAQLFLAVLATAVLVALTVAAAAQWSFSRGFIGYLNAQAEQRLELALPRLQQAFAGHGDWEFLRDNPRAWFDLVGVDMRSGQIHGAPPGPEDRELIASELLGSGRRMSLLDAQRQRVMGFPAIFADSAQREVVVAGRSVGWLVMAPVQTVTDAAALRFLDNQLHASLGAGVLAVVLAALVAWWVARKLLAPVRDVARATHRLAAGRYDTRVAVQGRDEVGQLAQDFNQLALTLAHNERIRRDYMADVSHELRTPLAVLRGELEAMEDGVHPATPEALRALRAEVGTLAQLVTDLHELALADVGALTYRKVDLDLAALLVQEAGFARRACVERQLQLDVESPDAPVMLLADESRLRQLLHNVLGNAVRYTDPGGRIQVRLRSEGGEAVLDVMDAKPGVSDEVLSRLLDRFFRVEGSRGRAGGGSGLGLAICQSIVQAHGGRIDARHSPLGGVWIELHLPLARAASGAAA
jgi:two-component system sensor histidine kinase BaeS